MKFIRDNNKARENFIKKSKSIYGNKYNYDKVIWVNCRTPVLLKCNIHNIEFTQKPLTHYHFNGCPECSKKIKHDIRHLPRKEFINRLFKIFGDTYDYETMVYNKVDDDVEIKCNIHNIVFKRNGNKLLNGLGCPECIKEGKKDDKEIKRQEREKNFIQKAINIHGDKYDYSKVKYKTASDKVDIFCIKHKKWFQQSPKHHLRGQGCPICAIERITNSRQKTTKDFIEKAIKKHGKKYDYSKVKYEKNDKKVCIICPEHGEFWQTAGSHLCGCGCPSCAQDMRNLKSTKSTQQFIEEAKSVHGEYYDYSKVKYKQRSIPVIITCPIHGDFTQMPSKHLIGHGCPDCGGSVNYSTSTFVEKARQIHGDKYDYSKTIYKNNREKVEIICHKKNRNGEEHGIFIQEASSHLAGHGCPKCSIGISHNEEEISNFLSKLIGENKIKARDRLLLGGKELDIYIPSLKMAIEYNGILWHSEKYGKDKNYHLDKLNECNKKDVHLIQIFEDEYINHREIVLDKIKEILHLNNKKLSIGGRKCYVREIKSNIAKAFLSANHIQGYANSSIHIACYYNNEIIGVMSFRKELKEKNNWELTRFATNIKYRCPGVASKLFQHFITRYCPQKIKSFADRRWTNNEKDNLYIKLGFKLTKILGPDYRYISLSNENLRIHKFNMRKKLLLKRYPNEGLTNEMTEKEMTKKLGFYRIWDCGSFKYEWYNQNVK